MGNGTKEGVSMDGEEETKRIPVSEFIKQIKEEELENPNSHFQERLEIFRRHMYEFRFDPIKFTIMGDAYISFFKISPENEEGYLAGGCEEKADILDELRELEEADAIVERALHICNILLYTSMTTKDKFYLYVANRVFYLLSGEPGFLTDIGMSPYNVPPQKKEPREVVVPNKHVEGMYQ